MKNPLFLAFNFLLILCSFDIALSQSQPGPDLPLSPEICEQGDIRLQGGNNTFGRVEICNNRVWGTVCEDLWGLNSARVACRQLGFSATDAIPVNSGFTNGALNQPIWLDDVQCRGIETHLIDCRANPLGSHDCDHSEDAGVICQVNVTSLCSEGDIRLQGGSGTHGRVEICFNNVWGTVCRHFWEQSDAAEVACKQLGFSINGATAINNGYTFGAFGQPVWLDDVQCQGNESRLIDCPANPLGWNNCRHSEDAGVSCQVNATSLCTQGDVRLQGGSDTHGRVEICYNNIWGTVCDRSWDPTDARIVCRQLGFTSGAISLRSGFTYGEEGQIILLYRVFCRGNETRLIDCPRTPPVLGFIGHRFCSHNQDAGVGCRVPAPCDTQGAIRLQGGNNTRQGRVEICRLNMWGTVDDNSWDDIDAQVVCRQLGYPSVGAIALTSGFINGDFLKYVWQSHVRCRGSESRLIDCPAVIFVRVSGDHSRDAGVSCQEDVIELCTQGAIRLQGGSSSQQGRVEMCHNNAWGTVCDDFWDDDDAQVVCRQLGFPGNVGVAISHGFSRGSEDQMIWLDDVECDGNETTILNCAANDPLGSHNCRHSQDAGASCQEGARPSHSPRIGNMLGGTGVFVSGFVLGRNDDIECVFDDQTTEGIDVTENLALCVVPVVHRIGAIPFRFQIKRANGSIITYTSTFTAISPDRAHVATIESPNLLFSPNQKIVLTWPRMPFISNSILVLNATVDVSMYLQEYPRRATNSIPTWKKIGTLITGAPNSGTVEVTIPSLSIRCNYPRFLRLPINVCPVAIKISVSEQYSSVLSSVGFWTGISYLPSRFSTGASLRRNCEAWASIEKQIGAASSLRVLFPCPSNQALANFDTRYERETQGSIYGDEGTGYSRDFIAFFHPNIVTCYRQVIPERNSAGQQCCYGGDGRLVKGERAGGSADTTSPKADFNRHLVDDLLPYVLCCKAGEGLANCSAYFEFRPSGSEEGYIIPVPACVYGDPHIVTLDGHKYTFNGKGEFTLIETSTSRFTLQGRMEQAVDASGEMAPGTVFTAIVAKEENTNTSVQFEVISNNLQAVVNSQDRVSFDDITVQEFGNVTMIQKERNNISAYFSEGANIEIKVENGLISVMMVSLPESMKGTTHGLMGTFNGIISDDLIPKSQEEPIPLDSSITDIHNQFGLSWIIKSPADSLFIYAPEESWSDFYAPDFVPMFEAEFNNTQLEEEAKEVCGDDKFCLFDIAATKRVEVGAATMVDGEMFDTIVEMAVPITCDPSCANGVCIENNTCKCNEGFEGGRCTIPIMEECEVNMCGNNATCVKHVSSYTCECPSGFVGGLCEEEEPPFQIRLINSSPRVDKDSVQVDFVTNKPSNSTCSLRGLISYSSRDCSRGYVTFSNLLPGSYILRVVSTTVPNKDERATERRAIHISNATELCDVHLINEGVSVVGRNVTVQFYGSQSVERYFCILDKDGEPFIRFSQCQSPLRYLNLNVGSYHLVVRPVGCGGKGKRLSENFNIDN